MYRILPSVLLTIALAGMAASTVQAANEPSYTRTEDVIYGRKFGSALTLDVFTPKKARHGAAIVWVVSGGWFSSHEAIDTRRIEELLGRGYTVFTVVHGSQPKYTIPEILQDMHRAVRFIRYHAKDYQIDPERIGISGASAGGHLSLMQGVAGDLGHPQSKDPIERASSRVQAVACFFPPTDFLNYGGKGKEALGHGLLAGLRAAFDVHELEPKTKALERITDAMKLLEMGRQISPITHVTADDPPTLIIHGDQDKGVPIQQAETIIEKFKEVKVPAKLVVKKGAGHGWPNLNQDMVTIADWFDQYLSKETKATGDKSNSKTK